MNEKELSIACKQGHKEAYQQLYYSYAPLLIVSIQRYVGEMEVAKDILHDSFLLIFDKMQTFSYKGEGSLRAWMSRICVNKSLMWLRQQRNHPTFSLDENRDSNTNNEEEDEEWEIPEEETIEGISEEVLLILIQSLPEGYRMVFNLYVFEEKSHREIAQILGINERSSSSQLARAKKLLAKKITEWQENNTAN